MSLTIDELRTNARDLLDANNWSREMFRRFTHLVTEMGEVGKELIKLDYTPDEAKRVEVKKGLGHELHDIIWNAVALAEILDIDVEAGLREKMAINEERKKNKEFKWYGPGQAT